MEPTPNPRPARWIAVTALIALAAGVGLAVSQWWATRPSPGSSPSPVTVEERALEGEGHADGHPSASKSAAVSDTNRWVDEVKGVDASGLDAERRETFLKFANAERCTCGCGFTLAACRTYDPSCEVSLPLATALLDSIRGAAAVDRRRERRLP